MTPGAGRLNTHPVWPYLPKMGRWKSTVSAPKGTGPAMYDQSTVNGSEAETHEPGYRIDPDRILVRGFSDRYRSPFGRCY